MCSTDTSHPTHSPESPYTWPRICPSPPPPAPSGALHYSSPRQLLLQEPTTSASGTTGAPDPDPDAELPLEPWTCAESPRGYYSRMRRHSTTSVTGTAAAAHGGSDDDGRSSTSVSGLQELSGMSCSGSGASARPSGAAAARSPSPPHSGSPASLSVQASLVAWHLPAPL